MTELIFSIKEKTWLILVFLIIIAHHQGLAQVEDYYYTVDTVELVVPSDKFRAPCNGNLDFVLVKDQNSIYSSLGIDYVKKVESILKIDLKDNTVTCFEIKLGDNLDSRTERSKLYVVKDVPGKIYLNTNQQIMEYDLELGTTKNLGEFPYQQWFHYHRDFQISAFYYNDWKPRKRAYLIKSVNGKQTKKVVPPMGDIELTHFSPIRLVNFGKDRIYWMSVSEPKVYQYDYDLNLMSEFRFEIDQNWISIEKAFQNPKYADLDKNDVFTTVSTLLVDTLSKNNSIQFYNDSVLVVSSMQSMKSEKSFLLRIDANGEITKPIGKVEVQYDLTKDRFSQALPHMCFSNGVWSEGVLYLIQRSNGSGTSELSRVLKLYKVKLNPS
jgi:hypothetical protein